MMKERLSASTASCVSASLTIQMQRKHIWLDAVIVCLTRLVHRIRMTIFDRAVSKFIISRVYQVH